MLLPGNRLTARLVPALLEALWGISVKSGRVFQRQLQQLHAVTDARLRQPLRDATAAIGLGDEIDRLDAFKMMGVAVLFPVPYTGHPDRRDAVVPERLAVDLGLDQRHMAGLAGLRQ